MPLFIKHHDLTFGIGDRISVFQKIKESGKTRTAIFEGLVIATRGGKEGSFTVRRVGEQKVGIERIFPLKLPSIEKIVVLKKGTPGVKHAKLYYLRNKSAHEIEKIYARAKKKKFAKQIKSVV